MFSAEKLENFKKDGFVVLENIIDKTIINKVRNDDTSN